MWVAIGAVCVCAAAQDHSPHLPKRSAEDSSAQKQLLGGGDSRAARFPFDYRSIDGSGNNAANPTWGKAEEPLIRIVGTNYGDGVDTPAGGDLPSARHISNECADQPESIENPRGISSMFWQWGQFLDHDLDLVPIADPAEPLPIDVPLGDPYFDPFETGEMTIGLDRSFGTPVNGIREQINEITAFIDASNVYGSDAERAEALRTMDGTGKLKTSAGDLLPFNVDGLPNGDTTSSDFFIAGDFRANEQVALTAMHTIWVREHNFWVDIINLFLRFLPGDVKYEWARAIVTAEMQAITYEEFLPILLGPDGLPPYTGYKADVNPGIANSFATAAYRFGHTMLPDELLRLDGNYQTIPDGNLPLADAFFNPDNLTGYGVEPYMRGLATQLAQNVDNKVVDGVRNMLFGPPGAGGFDLASLNIQRGRDHGLPSFNEARIALGLAPAQTFLDITQKQEAAEKLEMAYGTVDRVELWVGGLAEDPMPGAMVGETFHAILTNQFTALRDGDRFWYESYLPPFLVRMVKSQTLDRVIRRNSDVGREFSGDVFHVR